MVRVILHISSEYVKIESIMFWIWVWMSFHSCMRRRRLVLKV